jgi:hypothetical protein
VPAIFFDLSTPALVLVLLGLTIGSTMLGAFVGHRVRHLSDSLSESFGVMQAAMLGVVGLILAFGLSLALSRYEDRRAEIVNEANAIGTTYLRAQTLPEPVRGDSLDLLVDYTESAVRLSDYQPGSAEEEDAAATEGLIQRKLWRLAGEALDSEPVASAPRLYVETLNEMIDAQSSRVASLNNRVPTAVFGLEILGACVALGVLAAYLSLLGRGYVGVLLAAVLVAFLLFVTADLDRPTRGPIEVPDTVMRDQLESMQAPPAAAAPDPG